MKRLSCCQSRRLLLVLLACGAVALGVLANSRLRAQEDAAKPAATANKEKNDLLPIPEGDAKVLEAYMKKLAKTEPEGKTDEEKMAFSVKALATLAETADRLLAAKPSDKQAIEAHAYKLEALQVLVELGQSDFREPFEKEMKSARESKFGEVSAMGWQALITDRSSRWPELAPEVRQAFADDILAKLKAGEPKGLEASIVQVTALALDRVDNEWLAKMLAEAVPLLEKSTDKDVKITLEEANFEGMMRRLTLVGKPMEVSGELLEGGKVDWDSYRGKVVLVDFWASWCIPCREELPNVLAMYDAYHDKGFEVLGVSLDEKPEAAKKAVRDLKLRWDSIFPADENQREFAHPLAKHYGINGIPTAILVDQEGRVVHLQARAEDLRDELRKLLGEPGKPAEPVKRAAAKPAARAT